MTNPLETTAVIGAAGAPVLPLQLLQPLDASHPLSSPASPGGPQQRLIVSPEPGVGMELDLRPTRLLISKDGQSRSIWPVHLAGWQALGWQLLTPAEAPEMQDPPPAPAPAPAPAATETETETVEPPPAAETQPSAAGEALLAGEEPNFPAMTKAEIAAFCAQAYGVSLDGAMTKAELVATATGLHQEAAGETACEPAGDADPSLALDPAPDPAVSDQEFPDDLL